VPKKYLIILLLILLLQLALRIPFLSEPLERDEGAYGYIGQRILAGELPYRDVFDHKTPVVYYIYAFIIKAFGGSILSIRLFSAFYSLLTTFAVFLLTLLLFEAGPALVAAGLYAVFSTGPFIQGTGANTEVFMVLPMVLALAAFVYGRKQGSSSWIILAGILSGLAVMIKQTAVFNFLVLLGMAYFEKNSRIKSWLSLGAGFAVFPLFFLIYFALKNVLGDFIYCTILTARWYSDFYPEFTQAQRWDYCLLMIRRPLGEQAILWLGTVLALFFVYKDQDKKGGWLFLWAVGSFVGVAAPLLFFAHYFIQLLPALAVLGAYGIYKMFSTGGKWRKVLFAVLLLFLAVTLFKGEAAYFYRLTPYQISTAKYGVDIFARAHYYSQDLAKIIPQDKTLLVWASQPEIYYYLGKTAPTRYIYYLSWMKQGLRGEVLREIYLKRPDYIFWTALSSFDNELVDFISKNYVIKKVYYKNTWLLFVRKGLAKS
jgi:4-amino-4-deoxy-L-arabinose transferase-like glycosyltransferase